MRSVSAQLPAAIVPAWIPRCPLPESGTSPCPRDDEPIRKLGKLGQRTIGGECMAKMRKKNAMQLFAGGTLKEFSNAEFIRWGMNAE